jgi:hypothetical protein
VGKEVERTLNEGVTRIADAEESPATLRGWISEIQFSYNNKCREIMNALVKRYNDLRTSIDSFQEISIEERNSELEKEIQPFIKEKAVATYDMKKKVLNAQKEFRKIKIRTLGNPDLTLEITKGVTLATVAPFVLSAIGLALEFVLNKRVLQGSTSEMVSTIISITFGISAIAGAILASNKRHEREHWKNAEREWRNFYGNTRVDSLLGRDIPQVDSLPEGSKLRFIWTHLLAFGAPTIMLVMRGLAISQQINPDWWGGLSGSVTFLVLVACVYVLKSFIPVKYRQQEEYEAAERNMFEVENTASTITLNVLSTLPLWTRYQAESQAAIIELEEARNIKSVINSLLSEMKGANVYFNTSLRLGEEKLANIFRIKGSDLKFEPSAPIEDINFPFTEPEVIDGSWARKVIDRDQQVAALLAKEIIAIEREESERPEEKDKEEKKAAKASVQQFTPFS